jgi:ferritin-like metal-binding protein YciE
MPLKSLDKVLLDELKDLYSAENQILKALPKMAKAASSPLLKEAFTSHIEQTRGQVARLDRIARLMGEKSFKGKKCKAMEGLLEEGTELIEEGGDPAVLDAAMIGAAQKVEHYEIAGYGTARTHARHLGHEQVARLLQETLDEEGQTDKNLTKIAQRKINLDAKAEGDDGGRKGGAKGAAKGGAKKSAAKGGASKGAAKGGATKGAARSGGAKSGGAKGAAKGGAKSGAKSGARGTSGGSTSGMSRGGRAGAGSVAGESRTSAREGASRIARSAAATRTSMPGPGVTSRSLPSGTKRGGGATKTAGGRATASRSTSPEGRATASRSTSPAGRAKEAPAGRASAARSTRTGGEAKAAPQARTTAAPATTAPATTAPATTAPATSSPTVSPSTPAGGSAAPTSGVTPSSRTAPGGDVGQGRFGGGGGGGDASQAEIERAGLGPEDIEHTIEEIRSGEIAGGFSGADDFAEGESFEGADEGGNAGDAYDASTGG